MTPEQIVNRIRNQIEKELGFRAENLEKLTRAVLGTPTSRGLVDGVGEDAPLNVILAKYDELNGFITKDGYKVKNRVFFDPKTKKPVDNPKLIFLIKVNGEFVEHPEGAPESLELQVAKKQIEEEKKTRGKKA